MRMTPEDGGPGGGQGSDLPHCVRVEARLKLAVENANGRLRLAERHEAGAFRFRMPRREPGAIEAMLVNVAGGLAGGDRISLEGKALEGASLVISSAAGERIYRSAGDETQILVNLDAAAGANLVWLPLETILHDGARLRRSVNLTVHPQANLVFGEVMQFGRVASGERFRTGAMMDHWRVRIGGRMVFAEATRLDGELLSMSQRSGAMGNAPFMASLLLAGEGATERLKGMRTVLSSNPAVLAGASATCGLVFARLLSDNDVALRRMFLETVRAASGGTMPLPRMLMAGQ
ncbi:MAG: urease accessory protein UreD [Rhabdaerophilum sp.]